MTQAHPDILPFPIRPTASSAESPHSVLVVCADPQTAEKLTAAAETAGATARAVETIDSALQWMQVTPPDVCLVGSLSGADTVPALAGAIQHRGCSTQILCCEEAATSGVPSEGCEIIPTGCDETHFGLQLKAAAQRARLNGELRRLKRQLCNRNLRDMVGQSPAMQLLRQQVQQAADQTDTVMLLGESGSGVDLVSQAIHDASKRAHRPLIAIDCSVHSAETLEQELFGSAGPFGNFGGGRQPGRLEQADGGTLLLEEVHAIALPLQKRLAQVFAEQRFEHDHSGERIRFDVRIVFASQVDLEALIERGLFRAELLPAEMQRISLPSLRSRPEDIAALAEHSLRKQAAREGRPPRSLTLDALHLLQGYSWPGNLRELDSVIERACSIDTGRKLTGAMLESWLALGADGDIPTGLTLADMERRLIETTFARFAGNREKTAKALQIGIRTLSGKLREYGYPPRGGPGSNIKPWTPADAADAARTWDQKAA